MGGTRGAQDPYRELGVPRGASEEQIKAAHRALAKRYHPDAPNGDQIRFLAVQEAYLLLSDPIRRRDWDTRHAPGPVRATERPVAAQPSAPRPTPTGQPPVRPTGPMPGPRPTYDPTRPTYDPTRPTAPGTTSSGRDAASRSTTWSARGVPWWEDFRADGVTRGNGPPTGAAGPNRPASGAGSPTPGGPPQAGQAQPGAGVPSQGPGAGDIFSRSSGAAWSSAARHHFRKDDANLPRGGSFRYRGTQVVTGAEARQDAAAEARRASTPPLPPTPRPGAARVRNMPSQPTDPASSAGLMSRLRKLLGGS